LLRERGIEVKEEIHTKVDASRPLPDKMIDSLVKEESLVLCGVSD
jgi:hypothetical protein